MRLHQRNICDLRLAWIPQTRGKRCGAYVMKWTLLLVVLAPLEGCALAMFNGAMAAQKMLVSAHMSSIEFDSLSFVQPSPASKGPVIVSKRTPESTPSKPSSTRSSSATKSISAVVPAGTVRASPDTARGFGLSDLLLSEDVVAERADATRWNTLGVKPSDGLFRPRTRIGLVWEMYDLSAQLKSNRYRSSITVAREKRKGVAALAVRLLDRIGDVIKQGDSKSDEVKLSFDRAMRARMTQVEYLSLDGLGDAPGEYALLVEVTDLLSTKTIVRKTSFRVR